MNASEELQLPSSKTPSVIENNGRDPAVQVLMETSDEWRITVQLVHKLVTHVGF